MIGKSWFGNGKLLLTGEYLVMEGAKALAIPLKVGQYLSVKESKGEYLLWTAMKPDGVWFQVKFNLPSLEMVDTTDTVLAKKLKEILFQVRMQDPGFLTEKKGVEVETILEFDPEFGLGSSSTLISNIARWANVDPYQLLKSTFGGSGYDIACSVSRAPIIYRLVNKNPDVSVVEFNPAFKENLFFVYLGNKKRSAEGIKSFKKKSRFSQEDIEKVSRLTDRIVSASYLEEFEQALREHEEIMSEILQLPTVQSLHFPDYPGVVKSLGAWGGDFVLFTNHLEKTEFKEYLDKKNYSPVYTYDEAVFAQV